jgi:hypothetical protein
MEPGPNDIVYEVTLEEMCDKLFSKPPTAPFTNVIELQNAQISHEEQGSYIFEVLQNILFNGIATAFPNYLDDDGKKYLNLSMLTLEDCELLKKYMISLGYDICIDMIPLTDDQIALSKIDPSRAVKEIFTNKIIDFSEDDASGDEDIEYENFENENEYDSFKDEIKYRKKDCKCGWKATDNDLNKHFSDYYTHFIRTDNIGISLHFLQFKNTF